MKLLYLGKMTAHTAAIKKTDKCEMRAVIQVLVAKEYSTAAIFWSISCNSGKFALFMD